MRSPDGHVRQMLVAISHIQPRAAVAGLGMEIINFAQAYDVFRFNAPALCRGHLLFSSITFGKLVDKFSFFTCPDNFGLL